jgi:hypothetical protein
MATKKRNQNRVERIMRNRLHSHPELVSMNKKTIEYEVFYCDETDSVKIKSDSHNQIKQLIEDYSLFMPNPLVIRRGANTLVMSLDEYHEYIERKELQESIANGLKRTLDCKFIENDIPELPKLKV